MQLIKNKHTLFFFLLSLFSLIMFAQENKEDINKIKNILESHFLELTNINCQYKQERTLKMLTYPMVSSGNFTFSKKIFSHYTLHISISFKNFGQYDGLYNILNSSLQNRVFYCFKYRVRKFQYIIGF